MSRYTFTGHKDGQIFTVSYGRDHAVGWFLQISLIPDYKVGDTLEAYIENDIESNKPQWTKEVIEVIEVKNSRELIVKLVGQLDETKFVHYLEFDDLKVFDRDAMFHGLTYVEMKRQIESYGLICQIN